MASSDSPRRDTAIPIRSTLRTLAIRLIINAAIPIVVYLLLRPHVRSDLVALVIGAAVPVAYTTVVLLVRRRLDPVGIVAIVCFCLGLLFAIAAGGNELLFKLREDMWTGALGLAAVISVALHRPLLYLALQLAGRRNTRIAERIARPQARRITTVTTLVVGAILLVHALAMVVLALTTSTTTFLVISRPITWVIIIGGLIPLLWWIRHQVTDPTPQPRQAMPVRSDKGGSR